MNQQSPETPNEILGQAKTVRTLLSMKYSIDYYQREYKWEEKQVVELIDDLTTKFLADYDESHARSDVQKYGHYFLGSIIISQKHGERYIIDGQQRLTSLTLLLLYLRNRLHQSKRNSPNVDQLIFSEQYGKMSFNIQVDERQPCMTALFEQKRYDPTRKSESVQHIVARYEDIESNFPDELINKPLPYFMDWLIDHVHLVEIKAFTDEDAYTIFETMNDRGLSLSPTDMLKGYLLANIDAEGKRTRVNDLWRKRIGELREIDKDVDADFFKAWLRSQYAESIRERKKGATPGDFDLIGSEFHRWVRDQHERLGLTSSEQYAQFVEKDFDFYSRQYVRLMEASYEFDPELEYVFYNSQHGFTTQYQMLLAPLAPTDAEATVLKKWRLVGMYLDILINRRLWNFRSIAYSTMQYAMFTTMRDIRRANPETLARKLYRRLMSEDETFAGGESFYLHQQNRRHVHLILARLTDYLEQGSGVASHYLEFTTGTGKHRYEIEHIWADKPEEHRDEFNSATEFRDYRNYIGGLLLLPKSFNGSYGASSYATKLKHYFGQNLLAKSLHPDAYTHNPGFIRFVKEAKLLFKPHPHFKTADLDERHELYAQMARQLWDPKKLLQEVGK
ncbi:hypothetical protein ANRL4_03048 [Anaerolineae bacterium]|nr:hypothetical protein ANRL4_03048 [Anaerolineae bacterium]